MVEHDIAFTAVTVRNQEAHGLTYEHYSELEFLTLEETRFIGALTLSLRPDHGMVYCYPVQMHLDLAIRPRLDRASLLSLAKDYANSISADHHPSGGAVLPPLLGGPDYEHHQEQLSSAILRKLMRDVSLSDHLLMRGLGAIIKADMLWQRAEFRDVAVMMLHVAMEASFQMTLRRLRTLGFQNPTALDAGEFIDFAFGSKRASGRYFQESYEDRIRSVHPSSRFGTFPFPPLAADDFYFLRADLISVFVFLVTKYVWTDLWA